MNPKQQRFLARVVEELTGNKFLPSSKPELADNLRVPVQAIEAIVAIGIKGGEICTTSQNLVYGREQLTTIVSTLAETIPEGGYDPVTFRNSTGLSRRLADGLFQLLDQNGSIRREGTRWFLAK